MSSEGLDPHDTTAFRWCDGLEAEAYAEATFVFETPVEPERAALGIAREQSTVTTEMAGVDAAQFEPWTARVRSVEVLGQVERPRTPAYSLATGVYENRPANGEISRARAVIAHPIVNLQGDVTHAWNVLLGEVHRLGFLTAARLERVRFPDEFLRRLPGPRFGVEGLRRLLGVPERPIFCRSTRPAVGLTLDQMVEVQRAALRGGFDVIKDDELTADGPGTHFEERVAALLDLSRSETEATGERKLFVANLLCDHATFERRLEFCRQAGVEAALVAPALQGTSIAGRVADTGLVALSHNVGADAITRDPRYGVSPAVELVLNRLAGADLAVLPGNFSTTEEDAVESRAAVEACLGPLGPHAATLPILCGGKVPEGLAHYVECVGSTDFFVIAATALDRHPEGWEAGARAFRAAWDELEGEEAEGATSHAG